jgi:putative copper export protein/mono/diheme cytochrome c family protein
VALLDANGQPVVGLGDPQLGAGDKRLTVSLPGLRPGIFTVSYQATSAVDGHVTSGAFVFQVDPTGILPRPSGAATSTSPSTDPATIATRWSALVLLLLLFGTALFWLASARPALRGSGASTAEALAAAGGSALWGVLGLLAFGTFLCLAVFLTLAAAAVGSLPHGHGHSPFIVDFAAPFGWTPFAIAMRFALAGSGLAFLVSAGRYFAVDEARRRNLAYGAREGMLLGVVLGAAAVGMAGMSFAGHVAANGGTMFAAVDWLHLVGVGAWLGTLGGLALLAWRARRDAGRRGVISQALARHSRIAVVAAPIVAITGIANSPLVIGHARDLVASDYGDLVLAKATLFSAAVSIGAVNFFLVRRGSLRRAGLLIAGEAGLGLMAALAAATMLSIPPAASRVPVLIQATIQTLHLYGSSGSSTVHAAIDIPAPGDQLYEVVVLDANGTPRRDVEGVILELTPPGSSSVPRRVVLARTADPTIWASRGNYTPVTGDWSLAVDVARRAAAVETARFSLTVQKPLPPELVPPPTTGVDVPAPLAFLWFLPDGAAGWALLALLIGGVLALWLLERLRVAPGSSRGEVPTRLLAIGRVTLAGVAVLAALGVGSRAIVEAANRPTASASNPILATAASIESGRRIYLANCSSCHGTSGNGDGPQAAGMLPAPGPLQAAVASMTDGQLRDLVTTGVAGTRMPSFSTSLSENDRWDLVNYLRSFPPGR